MNDYSGWVGLGFLVFATAVGLSMKYGLTSREDRDPARADEQADRDEQDAEPERASDQIDDAADDERDRDDPQDQFHDDSLC